MDRVVLTVYSEAAKMNDIVKDLVERMCCENGDTI